jgi:hypothetical protein
MAFVHTTTTDAFDELRTALNPLLDDLYPVLQFPRFRDCPIDICFLIYEAYVLAESSQYLPESVSMNRICKNSSSLVWPLLDVGRLSPTQRVKLKVPLPFFPKLCLTDKLFGKEAATCLFRTVETIIRCPLAQRCLVKIAERFLEK